ncbi:hypothetical protein [Actinoplanes philippinensis]|uniref:hypothetical protein n=1 Tax=Actinoplanes philippinensis TaxID=35752 RepID=UPI001160A880|nr:hypothetical protein [Actinoplanes philippinensis]
MLTLGSTLIGSTLTFAVNVDGLNVDVGGVDAWPRRSGGLTASIRYVTDLVMDQTIRLPSVERRSSSVQTPAVDQDDRVG